MDIADVQRRLIRWADTANSWDKVGFFLAFAQTLGMEELHHCKNIIATVLKKEGNRKRRWLGPNPVDSFNKKKRLLAVSEGDNPSTHFKEESAPLPRSLVPRCGELPPAWWHRFEDVVGYDVEFVSLPGISGINKFRGGKVAVVGDTFRAIYSADVYHKAGSFVQDWGTINIGGIRSHSLEGGTPMHLVTQKLKNAMEGKLVVVVGDCVTDFKSVDLDKPEFHTFNLQNFYKRTNLNDGTLQPMSLRDMHFLEFGEDFQGNCIHSAEEDARATIKIFILGYVKRNFILQTRDDPYHYQIFDSAVKLRKMDEQGKFFCHSSKEFKDWNVDKCSCVTCSKLYKLTSPPPRKKKNVFVPK